MTDNTGFKGTRVFVSELAIRGEPAGAKLSVRVQFVDAEGLVHAITRHDFDIAVNPAVSEAAKLLMDAVIRTVEAIHFQSSTQPEEVIRGLAETLRDGDPTSEDPGQQG